MPEEILTCVEPVGGPTEDSSIAASALSAAEVVMQVARVGGKAPDFTGNAFHQGAFKQVSLSDYAGKWVVICFYPGDFTFV